MTLGQAQNICMEIDAKYARRLRSIKWTEVFGTEQELIEAIKVIPIPKDRVAPPYTFKGYVYIFSFAERLQKGIDLTEGQIKQAKRLAVEIEKARAIIEYMEGK